MMHKHTNDKKQKAAVLYDDAAHTTQPQQNTQVPESDIFVPKSLVPSPFETVAQYDVFVSQLNRRTHFLHFNGL